jgi:hypothetical protein
MPRHWQAANAPPPGLPSRPDQVRQGVPFPKAALLGAPGRPDRVRQCISVQPLSDPPGQPKTALLGAPGRPDQVRQCIPVQPLSGPPGQPKTAPLSGPPVQPKAKLGVPGRPDQVRQCIPGQPRPGRQKHGPTRRGVWPAEKAKRAGSTLRTSRAVPHLSTNRALRSLASEF